MESISDPKGKFPKALGNVVMIEAQYINQIVREQIQQLNQQNLIDSLKSFIEAAGNLTTNQTEILDQVILGLENLQDTIDQFGNRFEIDVSRRFFWVFLKDFFIIFFFYFLIFFYFFSIFLCFFIIFFIVWFLKFFFNLLFFFIFFP